ncbi:MAG: PhzF family phenazine biosynthesis protein [Hydrogenophaga sp.]|mgnify:CR=1 FL=1|jgi:PhzF family phenazine biosynthesis protein|uniref:PhzF family phenazine biosynthesis protein n=1 Tax=Hydrogenophaga sp. TaxID=1904254 RepID=UPI000EEA0B11|nr:PhzF family phenazine biosynthesis protein [Hydrogenophaga sp.]MDD3784569.1 PhzF family phenazine biosynthesis protein [Hydrogenophaga sp.]MDX9967489.1 PhzF family phenazine biosynthesis protein [Hydrogenophaga sp.]HAJ12531.1 phenazine biosynthesis protein PhzF [Comamonadaceae bacterium]
MTRRPFRQVDVFTNTPYHGNPLAVVLDGQGLDSAQMQRFTDWTNLSECTFVLPPSPAAAAAGADYRVRIFCPGRELPFAGHPTLGTCHAWLRAGGQPQGDCVVQECGAGLVKIRRQEGLLAFAAPPLRRGGPLDEPELQRITQGLGLTREDIVAHAWCDNGPHWRGVMLRSARQVLSVRPDPAVLAGMEVGLIGPHESGDAQFEVRAFFPVLSGIAEDPVTGSLNAALAQWLTGAKLAPPVYMAAQGTALGRAGRVHIERAADGTIWVGGHSVTCIEGSVSL